MNDKKINRYLFWARVINPVALAVYGLACFYLYSLCQYGGVKRKLPIILVCMLILLLWFLWCAFLEPKHRNKSLENHEKVPVTLHEDQNHAEKAIRKSRLWYCIACFILIIITSIAAMGIYRSSVHYNGKLSWFIQDLKNKRGVEFTQNNIYEYGLKGIFDAIQTKIDMPEELYLSSDFKLKYKRDGTILSFDTYLYGKGENGETESFLITYNRDRSEKITVYLHGYVNEDYDEEHRFEPFIHTMQVIPLKDTVSQWEQDEFGILYSGIRNWGYNTSGMVSIDREGNMQKKDQAINEIVGYTVSVYVPGKEEVITPVRFIPDWETVTLEPEKIEKNDVVGYRDFDGEEAFFLDKTHGYRLTVADAALGSRFYVLDQTQNAGVTWETLNEDPFLGDAGVSAGITFIDENLGFIGMSHSGGSYGDLYRTEDGGVSYKKISLPAIKVPLNEKETYDPFDLPGMPYEQGGKLMVLVGQGQDGDYKGGAKALYQSLDNGEIWGFVEEVIDRSK